jgi:8-oxo-dGTP pyrophosphatase MutT (NUDIX family)
MEEAKIKLNTFSPLIVYSRSIPNRYFFIFSCCISTDWQLSEKEIKLSHEHVEYRWINKDELNNFVLIESINHIKKELIILLKKSI